jgi:hypothetical protein
MRLYECIIGQWTSSLDIQHGLQEQCRRNSLVILKAHSERRYISEVELSDMYGAMGATALECQHDAVIENSLL